MAPSLGATTESVLVSAQAVAVDTTTVVLKAVVHTKPIEELPLNGQTRRN
jgi:hypothetical protein